MTTGRREFFAKVVLGVLLVATGRALFACGDGASAPFRSPPSGRRDGGAEGIPTGGGTVQGTAKGTAAGGTATPRAPTQEFETITLREGLQRTLGNRVSFETRVGACGPQTVVLIDGRFCHEFWVNGYFGFDAGRGDIKLPPGFDPCDATIDGIIVRWRTAGGFYDDVQIITKC